VVLGPWELLRWTSRHPNAELSPKQVENILRTAVYNLPIGGRTMPDSQPGSVPDAA